MFAIITCNATVNTVHYVYYNIQRQRLLKECFFRTSDTDLIKLPDIFMNARYTMQKHL